MKKKVNKQCDTDILYVIKIIFTIILIVSICATTAEGIGDAQSDYISSQLDCETKPSRIEYIFPFYRLGCWLGELPEEKTCDKTTENQ